MNRFAGYKKLRSIIQERFGHDIAVKVFTQAERELAALLEKGASIPAGEKKHTEPYIFPRVALYRAMKLHLGEAALPLMEEAIRHKGERLARTMNALVALPLMEKLFLRVFAIMAREQFGEKCGFRQQFYTTGKDEVRFDILACPYCRHCAACGCPELIHTFCDSDLYTFGYLDKLRFERTETLERGQRCDFRMVIDKQKTLPWDAFR